MSNDVNNQKKAILMCTCSFACPSMKDINFGELSERIRLELLHDYMLLHPRLCEENGENLMSDLLKDNVIYITPACKEEKQKKLLRDGFVCEVCGEMTVMEYGRVKGDKKVCIDCASK